MVFKKLIIVLAGVTHNFILGFLVLFIMALCYGSYTTKPIIGNIASNSASEKVGIELGDKILKINGKKTRTWDDVTLELTLANNEKYQDVTVEKKNGQIKHIKIKPTKIKDKKGNVSYAYGMGLSDKKSYGLKSSLSYATSKFGSTFNSMIVTIKALITHKIGVGALSGPVGIYSIVGAQSKAGLSGLLYLLAYLSINVGFINLIPFPAFDGYRAVVIIFETITKKKVNPKVDAIL